MALAYVARFATSAGKLEAYLLRKLRERGWAVEGGGDPEGEAALAAGRAAVTATVGRIVALGYVDDAAWATARAGSLSRRGYGARRIAGDLAAGGIVGELRAGAMPDERSARAAAVALARKRRLGPFGKLPPADRPARDRQVAVLLRAGHGMAAARRVAQAASVAELEQWVTEAGDDEPL